MTRIIADISVSLDGFVTGPDAGPDNGLGTGGEALHLWAFSDDPEERRLLSEAATRSGAVVLMGGGATIASALEAGLVDVLSLHLAPVVLGSGTPLFTGGAPRSLVRRSVIATPSATHLTYDVF
ncbi:dihydrofolate reductase family protein [Streptomyces sp. YS-3]|uniref:dihydrofolate reductase family protein n=1 Tax=Streptomyces sp. YS-3 TaxID=3381352 RepID=UPI0038629A35